MIGDVYVMQVSFIPGSEEMQQLQKIIINIRTEPPKSKYFICLSSKISPCSGIFLCSLLETYFEIV
ncbi:hypothetical protein BLOT_006255 [Blomia tropicalis]|nr:hypothetical protein BLOT_006255 [Blomia tropicalis]